MTLKFFNTLTKRKEIFKPIKKGQVLMYNCGPTVYAIPHIGNMRSFVVADLIRRYLEFKGFKVKQVMNITDIDDKTIRDSGKEGVTLKEFTDRFTKIFFNHLDILNIKRAAIYPKATENIKEMIEMTRALIKKGYAYVSNGSVYYSIKKFKGYGKLSHLDLKKIKIGIRVATDEYTKDNPQDFALMKKSTTEELKRGIYYETEWGKVRPGWHIECSVMTNKYLGNTLDIHTGGVDLIFPHHENEIAQSEAYTGKKFVNYWLHIEYLMVEGRKMAKSLGNFITLDDLLAKGYDPKAIRYLLLSKHYRQQLNFTFKSLEAAEHTIDSLVNFITKLREIKGGRNNPKIKRLIVTARKNFVDAMDDNLNTSNAFASIFNFIKKINKLLAENKLSKKDAKMVIKLMSEFDEVLGLDIIRIKKEKLPIEVEKLIQEREEARKRKDFETADKIREKVEKEFGIILEDTDKGVKWKRKR